MIHAVPSYLMRLQYRVVFFVNTFLFNNLEYLVRPVVAASTGIARTIVVATMMISRTTHHHPVIVVTVITMMAMATISHKSIAHTMHTSVVLVMA